MTKRRKTQDEHQQRSHHQQDNDYIPLPIQTFLWRQTSPFVRPFLGKARDLAQIEQRDACKLFERIIITNNIWGQSPSLTDAISSIDRWRLIKVSFPFVLQCTAALLNNKLIKDHNFNRLGGNEAKMMYTLQWILMNASEECADSENEAKANATNVAIAAATAASLLKPSNAATIQQQQQQQATGQTTAIASQGSTSSVSLGQDQQQLQQQQPTQQIQLSQQQSTCSNTIAKPRSPSVGDKNAHQQIGITSTATIKAELSSNNQSNIIPAASASAVATAASVAVATSSSNVINTLQMQATLPSSSSVSPIGSSTPTKPLTPTNPPSCPGNYLLPISSIQMFVYYFAPIMDGLKHSDFLTSNQRLEIGATLWEPLFSHKLPNIQCLKAQIKPKRNQYSDSSSAFFSQAHDNRQPATTVRRNESQSIGTVVMQTLSNPSGDRRRSSSIQDPSQFGDVFLGGPTPVSVSKTIPEVATSTAGSTSKLKHGDLIDHPTKRQTTSVQIEEDTAESYATYLDVAVLRCLFISDWQESGVYWSITFLTNRLAELQYLTESETSKTNQRPRSRSLYSLDFNDLKAIPSKGEYLNNKFRLQKYNKQHTRSSKDDHSAAKHILNQNKYKSVHQEQPQSSMTMTTTTTTTTATVAAATPTTASTATTSTTSAVNRFLRVEDAETSDSGGDVSKEPPKSPMRRLSFSSGMQTIANQIRKTSKRVKKCPDNQPIGESAINSESQLSIHHGSSVEAKSPSVLTKPPRRSSSADDLTLSQLSALSTIHKDSLNQENRLKDKQLNDSYPVITVTTNLQPSSQPLDATLKQATKFISRDEKKQASSANLESKFLKHRLYTKSLRHLDRLTRSQTVPKDLHYSFFETRKDQADQSEFMGATHYVDDEGRIDPIVVLKVLHSVSQRESACSQRVCDRILSLVCRLIDLGIMKENFSFMRRSSQHKDLSHLLPTRRHEFTLLHDSPQILNMDSDQQLNRQQQLEEASSRAALIHKILIDTVIRLYYHLGCPNGCGMESTVDHHHQGHQSKLPSFSGKSSMPDSHSARLRMKLRNTLQLLCDHNKQNFIDYIQGLVNERILQHSVDIFHSVLGFCKSDYLTNLSGHMNTVLNPPINTTAHVQFMPTPSTSGTNLNETNQLLTHSRPGPNGSLSSPHSDISDVNTRQGQGSTKFHFGSSCPQSGSSNQPKTKSADTLESVIITNSFKQLVTRMSSMNKELKLQENTSLYCDIRRLINFIRENFNGVFRSIVLSALIDCAKLLNQQQKSRAFDLNTQKRTSDTRPPSDDESMGHNGLASSKRGRVTGDVYDNIDSDPNRMSDAGAFSYSSTVLQQIPQNQPQDGSPLMQHRTSFGSYRFYSPGHPKHNKQLANVQALSQQDQQQGQSTGILSLSKAKKKLEQVFGSKQGSKVKLNSPHSTDDQNQSIGPNEGEHTFNSAGDEASRRASLVGHQSMSSFHETNSRAAILGANILQSPLEVQLTNIQLIRQNQQMYAAVRAGMSNFSFLMESCSPGDFLDPAMLAALLDLKSPIVVRAAIYLECANFVHRCNRGQWPSWMRMNVSMHRSSNAGVLQSSGSKFRKSSSIQRTARSNNLMYRSAGRAFYSWAEAIGARLEELLQAEQESCKGDAILEDTENDEAQLLSEQGTVTNSIACDNQISSDLDFFQPQIGNNSSPFALKMAACQLLFEVTTFLRETYRYLPPSINHHQAAGSKLGDKMTSIYDVSRAVTANRRWSMALSCLGFGQLPTTLNALSASSAQAPTAPSVSSGHLRNPTASSAISEQPERRISFILHETNDENEQEQQQQQDPSSNQLETNSNQAITSPIATSVNTAEQQQDAMRKLTAGRHLSQSSASSAVVVAAATCLLRSSGVIDSQTHRRKSIKLRKPNQEKDQRDKRSKFTQDLDEEIENSSVSDAGMRRTDSLRSRRRVSGISEKSDTSERINNGVQNAGQETQPAAELSGDESAGNGSCEEATEAAERLEADENRIMNNMPWLKAVSLINSSINCNCSHFPTCKPYCYKSHQNMCKRLISCVQTIYQDSDSEENYAASLFESRLANLINLGNQQKASPHDSKVSGGVVRAGSDCSASILNHPDHDSKRKDRKVKKQQQLDSTHDEHSHVSPKNKKYYDKSTNRMHSMMSVHLDSVGSGNGMTSSMMNDAVKALTAAKAKKRATAQKTQEEPQIIKYIRANVKSLLHCPMSAFLKGAVILPRDILLDMIKFSWELLLEDDQQLSRTAAVGFIISSIKCPTEASKLLLEELESPDASRKLAAINKFYVIWDARYQCWPRLEDGAFVHFKMAPPSIEFTLPSPKIAQESKPVVDPPWMPRKTSNVEEVTIGQDQTVQKSFVTATKTRRKQQIEIVTRALREKYDKLREDRENYHITSVPITLYAAYEPTLGNQPGGDEMDGGGANADDDTQQENRALMQMKTAQALFPTCLCQAAIVMINLLDDSRVTYEGSAVYEIANKVIWSCLVEDPALFLRHFFERLTRQNQNTIFQVLRRLIRFMPRLPQQAAYTLYNYLIGFIIYYIRSPFENSQKLIADTLSVLCLVVPSVYGLFLKDIKQILRKEQCDHNLLITANVPSAKKIIIHGSDSSGIPSQFPIDESTQFYHILVDSLEFFGIEKPKQNEYFLIDVRTKHMHNLHSYVRDYYSFKRSQHPELQLVNVDPNKAFDILQNQELINQFLEFGKVSMSLSIVKSSHMAVQRVLFLHEELMKLPTFPRKALETNFSLFRGPLGHQVFSMDRIHKICWVRLIARMFELTSGFFLQLGDIHLFLNAISGIFVLHCEEASVSRLCLATFINATHQFKNIFATDGFMPIMATIVQIYSNHQNNQLLCSSIEFVCKQFYIMHRKPFLLQLFGSVASRLNTGEILHQNQAHHPLASNSSSSSSPNFILNDPNRISPTAFFRLLQSLEKAFKDPLDILELVDAEKPLRAVDFCYQQDKEASEILDIISLCVTVTAYASESPRSTQMLIILETVVPLYMKHLQACTSKKAGQSMGKQAHKDELQKIQSISICIRTLIVNCEGLTRNFNGPLPSIDFRSSSIRRTGPSGAKSSSSQQKNQNNSAGSPMDFEEHSHSGFERGKRDMSGGMTGGRQATIVGKRDRRYSSDESEITRGEFIVPRDTLLNLVAEFLSLSTGRLVESAKKYVELHQKHSSYELLDVKSHLRLAEVANSLLKFASTDPSVMASRGLTRYMNEILPNTEWRQEAIRPALIMILKRLDKTFNRIAKKTWVKRSTDWEGAKQLLKGAYLTFIKHPYIVHLPHLKSLISCCQNIILSDGLQSSMQVSSTNLFHGFSSQAPQSGATGSQSATVMSQQGLSKQNASLLAVNYPQGSSLSPPGSTGGHASSAPSTGNVSSNQQPPSLVGITTAANLAERLAANASANNSLISQGFNSVTIRLIAMQLLQTGDSQTLESFIGNSMNTPEKLESLMLNLIYPMCIRVCSGAKEAPKLRVCDIMFILNIVLNLLAPQSASSRSCSSTVSSPKATSDTSQFILSKITTTIGSTQTGATALGIVGSSSHSTASSHQLAQHQEGLKIGFLGLKILCVCFESQLASEWIRLSRVIRDLAMQNDQPNGPLWDFLDFVATYRFPMFILLLPTIKCQLAKKVKKESTKETAAHYIQCQRLIDAKISGAAPTLCRSRSFLFVSLTAELRMLKEQLIAKRRQLIEGERQISSNPTQQSQLSTGALGSSGANAGGQFGDPQQGDHFTAYHRLSAAIASFANQGGQGRIIPGTSGQQIGTSAALKGACFAAQLATSTPIGPQISEELSPGSKSVLDSRHEPSQSSIRLSTAKSREEARKVMNTILRRTSYPHNQALMPPEQQTHPSNSERKNSQPPSPSLSNRQSTLDIDSESNQIIMDPAMLMAAFPAPRKSNVEGSGILKQLIQTIDRQNQKQQPQQQQPQQRQTAYQTTTLTSPTVPKQSSDRQQVSSAEPSIGDLRTTDEKSISTQQIKSSRSQGFSSTATSHKHE